MPELPVTDSFHWWMLLAPVGAYPFIKFIIEIATGSSREAMKSQSNLIEISESGLKSRDERVGRLEERLDEASEDLRKAHEEIHKLMNQVQRLVSQMIRAGIEPDLDEPILPTRTRRT